MNAATGGSSATAGVLLRMLGVWPYFSGISRRASPSRFQPRLPMDSRALAGATFSHLLQRVVSASALRVVQAGFSRASRTGDSSVLWHVNAATPPRWSAAVFPWRPRGIRIALWYFALTGLLLLSMPPPRAAPWAMLLRPVGASQVVGTQAPKGRYLLSPACPLARAGLFPGTLLTLASGDRWPAAARGQRPGGAV
jgi:hypothetical protein